MKNKIHEIPKGWELKKLKDVCDTISSGGTPSRSNSDYYGGDIPWLKIGDLNNDQILDSNEKITDSGLKNSSAKLFPKNTVLFAMYGATIGKTGILKKSCATNQAICGMICSDVLNPYFLFYFLQSKYYEIRNMAEGGAQPNVNQNKLKNLDFLLPPLEIQNKIIQKLDYVLGQLKEKKKEIFILIEQNKERIDFFEKFFFSEIMKKSLCIDNFPKIWSVKPLVEITDRIGGGTPRKNNEKYYQGNIPWLTISDLSNEITFPKIIYNSKMSITEEAITESSAKKIPKNAVVLGSRVGVGKLGISGIELTTNQDFSSFVCSKEIDPYFLGCYLLAIRQKLQMKSRGLTVKGIITSELDNLKIGYPTIEKQKQIIENIKNAEEKFKEQKTQFQNIKQNYELKIKYINHIQSSILDLAFSGKLVN